MELLVKPRQESSPAIQDIRQSGYIPAVVYGRAIPTAVLLVPLLAFEKLYREAGEATIIDLRVEGESVPRSVLIKDIQFDPVTEKYLHIDFYQVRGDEELKTTVPLKFIGEAPAVKDFSGILITNKDEVEVECFPKDLPPEIEVDISVLVQLDDSIAIKDLQLPPRIKVLNDLEESVIVVAPPAAEEKEEIVVSEAEAVASVEAIKEKPEAEDQSADKEQPETEK